MTGLWNPDLVEKLRTAKRWTVFSGAGMSAESGVPTFRDAQTGLWANFRAEDLATPEAFRRNPKMVWEWYETRREKIAMAAPNAGHLALARLESMVESLAIVTQNIDNLHRRAGSRNIVELHGNIFRTKCFDEEVVVERWDSTDIPPRCPRCGGMLRPDVVWFGEMLPAEEMNQAVHWSRHCDVFLSIGTSGLVYPAAGLPFDAVKFGAIVIEINPDETPLSPHAHAVLRAASGVALTQLVESLSAAAAR